ncbi:MAG: cadherin-like domain-containing protein, partial [Pirellulales bacterium]
MDSTRYTATIRQGGFISEPTELFARGAVWKYRDDLTNSSSYPVDDLENPWTARGFDDGTWDSGPAILGYPIIDAGPIATMLSYGPDANDKYRTALFRRSFDVADVSRVESLTFDMLIDDGAAFWINGVEVIRHNLPGARGDGTLRMDTLAPDAGLEGGYISRTVDMLQFPGVLLNGANSLAVEVHQFTADSSDLGFDLRLTAILTPQLGPTGVLANDRDVEGDAMTAELVAGPYHGTLDFHPDGTFLYTPAGGFSGVDQFTYRASDGAADSNLTLVTINVGGVNLAPSAADDRYIVWGGRPLVVLPIVGVLANDFDVNGDAMSATVVYHPFSGVVALSADGSFSYTPEDGFTGRDSF